MPKVKEKSFFFCLMQEDGSPIPTGFRTASDLDELVTWAESPPSREPEFFDSVSSKVTQDDEPLQHLLTKIAESGDQQFEMLAILSMVQIVFPMIPFQGEAINKTIATSDPIKKTNKYSVYQIQSGDIPKLNAAVDRFIKSRTGLSHVTNAMLLSIVAIFDSQMSDVVRVMLGLKSDRLRNGQRQIALSKIMTASSLEEIINDAINDEVYQFSRDSHDDQIKYIEDNFSIDIRKPWKRWPDIIEVFERRNLVAHGEATYTSRYAGICTKHGHKGSNDLVGQPVSVDQKYLRQALSLLSEFAILLIFSLWRKHVMSDNTDEDSFSSLNEICFNLIDNRRYGVAVHVIEYALNLKGTTVKESTRLRLVVNLASAQKHQKQNESCEKTLSKIDWSATSDDYKICVAALREDELEVIKLMPIVKSAKLFSSDAFMEWPVFDFIRSKPDFRKAFKRIYGKEIQPFISDNQIDTVTENSTPEDQVEGAENSDGSTMH